MSATYDKVVLLVFTDGRSEYFQQTFASWERDLNAYIWRTIIIDDSADPQYALWLKSYRSKVDEIISHEKRMGFGGTIRDTWANRLPSEYDWVLHLEDDFTLNRELRLSDILTVMRNKPYISQMALLRQPWNPQEKAAGGIWQLHPEDYLDRSMPNPYGGMYYWMEHNRHFTTNPCVYPKWVVDVGWPDGTESEGHFGFKLRAAHPQSWAAYWGSKFEPPMVTHIGAGRKGINY